MRIHWRCLFRGHRHSSPLIWNQGIHFSTCVYCGCDMIRKIGRPWRALRKEEKVVWRSAGSDAAIP
jgi:hypothetical protein